jgi:hypothetical protein
MDWSNVADEPQGHDALRPLLDLARQIEDAEDSVEALESALSTAKKKLHHLRTVALPDKMAEFGLDSFSDEDGNEVRVEQLVSGSLPKEIGKRNLALQWLDRHGGGSLLKTKITMDFGRDDRDYAMATAEKLELAGEHVKVEETVHPQTLCAFIREKLASGEEVEPELLGVYVGKVAKIKRAKP